MFSKSLLTRVWRSFMDLILFIFLVLLDCNVKSNWDKIEKISDIYKVLFIEKGLRGGICYIAKRYAKANNKYMKVYDSKKPSKFITYLDRNNLYGWGMSGYLSYGRFKWLKNGDGFDVVLIGKNTSNRLHSRSWSWISW